jgi:hypothetical protein
MHNLKRLTRDDTEHGNDYHLAAEVDKMLTAQQSAPVKSLECAHCHTTIEALNQKAMHLIDENQRLRAELKCNTPPAAQPAVPLTEKCLASACLSYRHDFGLMDETDRGLLMFQAREWARAFGLSITAAPEKGQP